MKDNKLNNLLSIDDFSEKEIFKSSKVTKRTDVAKDVLQENAYVEGKDILKDKMVGKDEIKSKELNNLICLCDFTKNAPNGTTKYTKRTDVAKDILKEFKNVKDIEDDDDDDDDKVIKKSKKCKDDCDDDKDNNKKSGLSAAQKKLPKPLQDSILKKMKK